jgi:hypothetical protein
VVDGPVASVGLDAASVVGRRSVPGRWLVRRGRVVASSFAAGRRDGGGDGGRVP